MGVLIRIDKSSCCGCTLRTACLVLLYLTAIFAVCSFSGGSVTKNAQTKEILANLFMSFRPNMTKHDAENIASFSLGYYSAYQTINQVIDIILLVFCLYGVHMRKPSFMVPYIIYFGISLVTFAIALALVLLTMLILSIMYIQAFPIFLILTLIFSAIFGLCYYIFLLYYNCYREMKEEQERPGVIGYSAN